MLNAIHRIGDDVRDAETGQRGYLLTGRESYLTPYSRVMTGSNGSILELRGEAAQFPRYLPRIDSLNYFVQLKLAELYETIRLSRDEGYAAAEAIVRTDRGEQAMVQIRRLLTSLDAGMTSDLGRAQTTARREQQMVVILILTGTLLAGLLAIMTNVMHKRQARDQDRTSEELERQSYELQLQAAELEAANAELELTTREMVAHTVDSEVSQLRLAGILGSATEAIISFDDEYKVVYFNAAAEQLLCISAEAASGTPIMRFIPERLHPSYADRISDIRRTVRSTPGVVNVWELIALRGDDTEVPVEASMSYARAGKQGLFTMIMRDVSERRQLEDQFRQAQKMEAVGRLAGGIAHDFNNLLTVIGASTDFLLMDMVDSTGEVKQDIAEIRRATDRAAGLTRQLLAFSRRQLVQPQLLDLNTVVGEMETMLRRLIGEDVILQTGYTDDPGLVRLDRGQVEQIVVNLVVNARDAMPGGGLISLRTDTATTYSSTTLDTTDVPDGGYVVLSVSDTGIGIDEEIRVKIFEPFFTTKEQGKGTGLGLSTVYGIVKQYGGDITVHSELGHGTEFRLYFPRAKQGIAVSEPEVPLIDALHGTETILVVEDEEPLRRLSRRILESRGYTVLDAGNGHEAIAVMARHGDDIDLLLSDIVMPNMGGRELVERLLPVYPSLRVLFMSGYTEDMMLQHRIAELGITVLEKPFTPETLARMVRSALDRTHEKRKLAAVRI
jgi:PAS domain S-box-containing protein